MPEGDQEQIKEYLHRNHDRVLADKGNEVVEFRFGPNGVSYEWGVPRMGIRDDLEALVHSPSDFDKGLLLS